jgi:hypothetical protein
MWPGSIFFIEVSLRSSFFSLHPAGGNALFCGLPSACYIQFTAKKTLWKEHPGNFSLVFSCRQKTFESFVQFRHRFSF